MKRKPRAAEIELVPPDEFEVEVQALFQVPPIEVRDLEAQRKRERTEPPSREERGLPPERNR